MYLTLVKDVKAAFRIDELVRIDCRGLNPSDYKKIGAKLRVRLISSSTPLAFAEQFLT